MLRPEVKIEPGLGAERPVDLSARYRSVAVQTDSTLFDEGTDRLRALMLDLLSSRKNLETFYKHLFSLILAEKTKEKVCREYRSCRNPGKVI